MSLRDRLRRIAASCLGVSWYCPEATGVDPLRIASGGEADMSIAWMACEMAKMRPLSSLPVHVYRQADGVRVESPDHPLNALLRHRWNPLLTSAEGLRWLVFTKDTRGNAYVRVAYDGSGSPIAFFPISSPVEASVSDDLSRAFYTVKRSDDFTQAGTYPDWQMLHFKSSAPDCSHGGVYGRSLARIAAENIGLSIDLERFYSRLLNNGSHFPGYLETDADLSPGDKDEIAASLHGSSGIVEAGKVRIFDKGLHFRSNPLDMHDISFIDQQTWVLQQCCRVLGVPPQEVHDLSHATYSNVEQGAIQFAQKTLVPEASDIECSLRPLLRSLRARWPDCYVKFDMSGILRGEYQTRMEGYRIGIYAGIFTQNEVRAWEELPPMPGGDELLRPTAYYGIGPDGRPVPGPADSLRPVLADMRARIAARMRETGDAAKAREFAARVLSPYATACALGGVRFDMEGEIREIERMSHA